MGRKRSKSKADFQKVKLKVGRRILKATNITNLTYKSKKIILPHQLKNYSGGLNINKEYTIEEFLKQICHHNPSSKCDALNRLKELVSSNHELIYSNLTLLLTQVSTVVFDKVPAVRKAALEILKIILNSMPNTHLTTVSSVLSAYLNCGRTNLDTSIRRDSLKLLDLMLNTVPDLICFSRSILEYFLDLVSSRETGHKLNRSLTISPNEKITSQTWRIQVLKRVAQFLTSTANNIRNQNNKTNIKAAHVCYNNKEPFYLPIYKFGGLEPQSPQPGNKILQKDCNTEPRFIKAFITEFMPLLFAIWTEANAENCTSSTSVLSYDGVNSMGAVVHVISCLTELVELIDARSPHAKLMQWFKDKYSFNVQLQFMFSFPFSQHRAPSTSFGKDVPYQACLLFNLAICNIFTLLVLGTDHYSEGHSKKVLSYLMHVIKKENTNSVNIILSVTKIIKYFLSHDKDAILKHICALYDLYQCMESEDKTRKHVMTFFADVVLDFQYKSLLEYPVIKDWLHYLPMELITHTEERYFLCNLTKKIATRGYPSFLEGLQEHAGEMIELLQVENEVLQQTAAELICKVGTISLELFQKLAIAFREPSVSLTNIFYILECLGHRSLKTKDPGFTTLHFASFLFNVVAGVLPDEENSWINDHIDLFFPIQERIPFNLSSYMIVPSMENNRHSQIAVAAIKELAKFPDTENMSKSVYIFLSTFFESCQSMPVHCAVALLDICVKLTPAYFEYGVPDEDFSQQILELILSIALYEMALSALLIDEDEQKFYTVTNQLIGFLENLKDMEHILKIIGYKITAIQSLETAQCLCCILMHLQEVLPMKEGDGILLDSILKRIKRQVGREIENQPWWMSVRLS